MECIKNCKCNQCENLIVNHPITFVERRGLTEHRETLVGVKCLLYGQCADSVERLRTSDIYDDLIFIEPFKEENL